jgi:uncharacterized protein
MYFANALIQCMENNTHIITIEIAYTASSRQHMLETLSVPVGCNVAQAIAQSTQLSQFSDTDNIHDNVGIFGHKVALSHILAAGDRIEIYRPLRVDPKQARRLRANPRK